MGGRGRGRRSAGGGGEDRLRARPATGRHVRREPRRAGGPWPTPAMLRRPPAYRSNRATTTRPPTAQKRFPVGLRLARERLQPPQPRAPALTTHRSEDAQRDPMTASLRIAHPERQVIQQQRAVRRPRTRAIGLENDRDEHLQPVHHQRPVPLEPLIARARQGPQPLRSLPCDERASRYGARRESQQHARCAPSVRAGRLGERFACPAAATTSMLNPSDADPALRALQNVDTRADCPPEGSSPDEGLVRRRADRPERRGSRRPTGVFQGADKDLATKLHALDGRSMGARWAAAICGDRALCEQIDLPRLGSRTARLSFTRRVLRARRAARDRTSATQPMPVAEVRVMSP